MAKNQTNAGSMKRIGKAKTQTAKPATRTTAARTTRKTATRTSKTTQRARQDGASARLTPIRKRQSRDQILATVATDSGVERPIVERVARSLSQTLTRHLMRNGSGRVDIPYLGAALWRGQEGARKARTMMSGLVGRNVQIPAKRATAVPRLRVHQALREIVARA